MDVDGMTLAEEGAYSKCVRYLWKMGPLPEERLRRFCEEHFDTVAACLRPFAGGLSFGWLEVAREAAVKGRAQRSDAGKKSSEAQLNEQRPLNGRSSISISSSNSTTEELRERENGRELVWPTWAGEKCKGKWAEFIAYRIREKKARYKSIETEQKALDLACRYFPNGPHFVEGLEHTMAKTWQFPVDPAEHKYPFGQSAPGKRTQEELLAKWDVLRRRPGGAGPEDIYDDKELLELIYPGKYTR